MLGKINKAIIIVSVVALASSMFLVSQAYGADWSVILEKARARYANFERKIRDMVVVYNTETSPPQGKSMTSEMKVLKKGKRFRTESVIKMPQGEMKNIVIYDGRDTWIVSPFAGKKKVPRGEEKQYNTERDWREFLSERAEIIGTEQVDRQECYVVLTETDDEHPFTKLWLDKKSLLLRRAEGDGPQGRTMRCEYSDFRRIIDDLEIPYRSEVYIGGELVFTHVVKSLDINTGLSDSLFDPDRIEIEESDMQKMIQKMMEQRGK